MLGTSLLWFGWFGFNGGSALAANDLASTACINTNMAACAGGLMWMFLEYIFKGKVSAYAFPCGLVCGLVVITPGCGFVPFWSSIIIGMLGSSASFLYGHYKHIFYNKSTEDTLDVFGCLGVSGLMGGFCTGLFA